MTKLYLSKAYYAWLAMRYRCYNPKSKRYARYGGRGIKVCERWLVFEDFLEDMGHAPKGFSLDRIDNDGDYCPENCRWASAIDQQNNTKNTKFITHSGERKSVSQWAREAGISRYVLHGRLKTGWSMDKALSMPVRPRKKRPA